MIFDRIRLNRPPWYLTISGQIDGIVTSMIFLPEFCDKYDQNDDCVNRMYREYTHTFTHMCAQISYKRHFFRCSANSLIL